MRDRTRPLGKTPTLEDVCELLARDGKHPVLLHINGREKGPTWAGWREITYTATLDPAYQELLLAKPNTGVRLGEEDLCTIDCDTEPLLEAMQGLNPRLQETLCSCGECAGQLWGYITGERPHQVHPLKVKWDSPLAAGLKDPEPDKNGMVQIGEFRAEGGQSVIRGIHPCGRPYTWPNSAAPITLCFDELTWPADIAIPWERAREGSAYSGSSPKDDSLLRRAIARLSVEQLWDHFGYPPRRSNPVKSPFRTDKHPSLSVYDQGRRFKDHGHEAHRGDSFNFYQLGMGQDAKAAFKGFVELAGLGHELERHMESRFMSYNPEKFQQFASVHGISRLAPEQIQVLLPRLGRNERAFAKEIGQLIGPLNAAFMHADRVIDIVDEPVPENTQDQLDRNKLARGGLKFRGFTGARTKGWIEQFLTTGHMVKALDEKGNPRKDEQGKIVWEFKEKTMSEENARALIENPFFQKQLPCIRRILTVPVPILTPTGDIRFPQPGFNSELEIYCALNAPAISALDIEQALQVLENAHQGFEFKNPQSRTHAYARFLTPYFRGHIGFGEPIPCWFYNANRPRAGKDYLSGITQITYEGFAFEDAALSDSADETAKRITAGLLAGRRFFHFANCQGYLQDKYFIQAVTDSVWRTRLLGSNNAQSDLLIPNEAEYSLSANAGLSYREDVEPRLRQIELAYYEEDANSRTFPVPDLHGWAVQHRSLLLSAAHSIYQYWVKNGCPEAHPFTSYKRWGNLVGGACSLAGLGDPTLPHDDDPLIAGDPRTAALKAVFALCYDHYPELWKDKKDISTLVAANQDDDERLEWFGDLSDDKTKRKAILKLGRALALFHGRWLAGIRLLIDTSQANVVRRPLKFTKNRS